jgi:3-hydroxyisobutyrate dehydrogenase-like beta-hydroxyacid dehydrogenase
MSVGFVGLGNMGQGMADNLLSKGADLTVFTRTQSKIEFRRCRRRQHRFRLSSPARGHAADTG